LRDSVEVNIADLISTIRTVDDTNMLSQRTLERIVQVVLQAVNERDMHRERVRSEQAVNCGVRATLGQEDL